VGLGGVHRRVGSSRSAGHAGERLTAHRLVGAAAPLGAAFGGVLLQYLSAPLMIAISGLAGILAGLGGLVSPSVGRLQRGSPSVPAGDDRV